MDNQGILYIATGEEFVKEAVLSAQSVRKNIAGVQIALISDTSIRHDIFDEHISIENASGSFADQIQCLAKSPFERTLCLDTDIYMDAPANDVFDLLDKFDIAVAHNHDRSSYSIDEVPDAFPEYNTGVVAYQNTNKFNEFLDLWDQYYQNLSKQGVSQNQPSFRKALYESDLRISTLPPEYNLMVRYPGHAIGTVKMFHGRLLDIDSPGAGMYEDVPTAAEKINSIDEHRVYTQLGGLSVRSNKETSSIHKLRMSVYRYGFQGTIQRGISKLLNK